LEELGDDEYLVGWAKLGSAEAAVTGGESTGVLAQLQAVLRSLRSVGGSRQLVEGVALAGCVCALEERFTDAAVIFAAADHITSDEQWSQTMAWTQILAHPDLAAERLASTRLALGEELFREAWASGSSMLLPQAINHVLQLNP
jgi:hypothetical protein